MATFRESMQANQAKLDRAFGVEPLPAATAPAPAQATPAPAGDSFRESLNRLETLFTEGTYDGHHGTFRESLAPKVQRLDAAMGRRPSAEALRDKQSKLDALMGL